jgi:hypothetical protein
VYWAFNHSASCFNLRAIQGANRKLFSNCESISRCIWDENSVRSSKDIEGRAKQTKDEIIAHVSDLLIVILFPAVSSFVDIPSAFVIFP